MIESPPPQPTPLHDRLESIAGEYSYRRLSELTGVNAESVRRYMQGASPSADFLIALSARLGVSGEWLLTGKGPIKTSDARSHALREAKPAELLGAVAAAVERLTDRVDRLELFVQALDTRLRALQGPLHGPATGQPVHSPTDARAVDGAARADDAAERAERIGLALAQRPREDAR